MSRLTIGLRVSSEWLCRAAVEQSVELDAGLACPGVGESLQLQQVIAGDRASGQQLPGPRASLVQQLTELVEVAAPVREVGQPIQGFLVAVVG